MARSRRSTPPATLVLATLLSVLLLDATVLPVMAGFQTQQTFATGSTPRSVAAMDLNGDGKPDLAVANEGSNTVSVLLNTTPTSAASPSFATQQTFATGSSPYSVAAADLNGDGKPDLAVANRNSNTVGVLLNTTPTNAASPSFAVQQTFATGAGPFSVAAADLNGDGKPDLAVANEGSNTVSVLLNTTPANAASPSFAAQQTFTSGFFSTSVAAADLNGDARPDLAVAHSGGVSVLLNIAPTNAASPSFAAQQTFATGFGPVSVAAADLNGDGRPDLAVGNFGSGVGNTVSVLLNIAPTNAASPSFAAQQTFATGSGPFAVAAMDLNGDGRPDLAVVNGSTNTVSVLLNTTPANAASPSFAVQQTFATGTNPNSVAAADLNGDGKPDLAVANQGSDTVSVLLGSASGTLQFASSAVLAAESSGNAALTLARTGSTDGQVSAIVSLTGGTATPGQDFTFAAPQTVTWADGDGLIKTVNFPLAQDAIAEGSETIQFALTLPANPFGAALGADTATTLTILDGESTPVLTIANVSQVEGNSGSSNATFTVSLSGPSSQAVAVQYATADGSATAGVDYTATSGTLGFAPGETTKTVAVPILGDTLVEGDETFTLTLSSPTNATLGNVQAVGIIANDDESIPVLSVANVSQAEGNSGSSNAAFTVSLSGPSSQAVAVQYATADGSATAGSDYTATSGTLSFAPGETTKTVAVPILGDTLFEGDETFTLTLSSPTNATLGNVQAVGLIINDDALAPAVACTPRPNVTSRLAAGGGQLAVHVEATPLNTQQNNPLQRIVFDRLDNAKVTLNGQVMANGQAYSAPPNTIAVDFTIERVTPGQPTTVHLTVVDGCGGWKTFVGGGTGAGF